MAMLMGHPPQISGFLVILHRRYQMFHGVAPMGGEQPHDTDTACLKLS